MHRLTQYLGKMQVQLHDSELGSKPACVSGGGQTWRAVGVWWGDVELPHHSHQIGSLLVCKIIS